MAAERHSQWSLYHIIEWIVIFQFTTSILQPNNFASYSNSEQNMTGRVKPEKNFAPSALSNYKMYDDYF